MTAIAVATYSGEPTWLGMLVMLSLAACAWLFAGLHEGDWWQASPSRARVCIAAAALASVRHVKGATALRERHQERAARLKSAFRAAGVEPMPSMSHIVPVRGGDAALCREVSRLLLEEHGLYVTPINYPTVPRGTERLRFTPGPSHDEAMMRDLTAALVEIWDRLELELKLAA